MIVIATMIAQSPGPLSKRFGQTVESILRRDNIEHWNKNKDNNDVVEEETNAGEETGKIIVVNIEEESTEVTEETGDNVEDVVANEDEDVVIISDTPGNIVVKEEPVEEIVVVEEDSDLDIEESTLIDDIEVEESNDSIEVHVEDRSDCVSEAETFATEKISEPVAEKISEPVVEEAEDDIVYYKDARMKYEFGDMRKENGVYFVPLRKPVLIQTPVVKLLEPISGVSTVV